MAVDMKRSTNIAPVVFSISYLMGSACIGISMITLKSLGTSQPELTRSRFTVFSLVNGPHYNFAGPAGVCRVLASRFRSIAFASTAFAPTISYGAAHETVHYRHFRQCLESPPAAVDAESALRDRGAGQQQKRKQDAGVPQA